MHRWLLPGCILAEAFFEKRGQIVFHKPMYGATIVSPYYKCKKFRYDPLRRVPKRPPKLPAFSPEDFSLD